MASKGTKQRPQVQIRVYVGGVLIEETELAGPLVAMKPKGGK